MRELAAHAIQEQISATYQITVTQIRAKHTPLIDTAMYTVHSFYVLMHCF